MLNECVYFYDKEPGRAQCYVAEEHCSIRDRYFNEEKSVDPVGCYYIPRSQMTCSNFTEGDLVRLQYEGSDPDADNLVYSFEPPFNSSGEWQTEKGDAGSYISSITANDGEESSVTSVCFLVMPRNEAPVLTVQDVAVTETEVVDLKATCEDEGERSITYSGAMRSGIWRTTYDDEGVYNVTVTCTDDAGMSASSTVTVTVLNKNRAPFITAIATKG